MDFLGLHSIKQAMFYVTVKLTTSLCAWIRCISVFTPPFTKMSNENVHILSKVYIAVYFESNRNTDINA